MNKRNVRDTKMEKHNAVQLSSGRVWDISPIQKSETKEGFWPCHVTLHKASNEHPHCLREIIIYCLPTQVCFYPLNEVILITIFKKLRMKCMW